MPVMLTQYNIVKLKKKIKKTPKSFTLKPVLNHHDKSYKNIIPFMQRDLKNQQEITTQRHNMHFLITTYTECSSKVSRKYYLYASSQTYNSGHVIFPVLLFYRGRGPYLGSRKIWFLLVLPE